MTAALHRGPRSASEGAGRARTPAAYRWTALSIPRRCRAVRLSAPKTKQNKRRKFIRFPHQQAGTFGRVEWRAAFAQRVLPSLRVFSIYI